MMPCEVLENMMKEGFCLPGGKREDPEVGPSGQQGFHRRWREGGHCRNMRKDAPSLCRTFSLDFLKCRVYGRHCQQKSRWAKSPSSL